MSDFDQRGLDKIIKPDTGQSGYKIYNHEYIDNFIDRILYYRADTTLTQELLEAANTLRGKLNGVEQKLAGDIKEEYYMISPEQMFINLDLAERVWHNVVDNIRQHITLNDPDIQFEMPELWVNYQKPTEYNPLHLHGTNFSFVWYLDIPEQIRQEHLEQVGTTPSRGLIDFVSSQSNDLKRFNPQTSDVFVFRSDHKHAVHPFYSECERVSMSGNIIAYKH